MATHESRDKSFRRPLLVALFLCAISLPLAANLAGVDGGDPGAENRELAAFPRVDGTRASLAAFPAGFGLWFDDHFGFRSALVRWYGESRLFVLGVSPSAAVVKGADGWFFYGDDKAIEDYANATPMTPPRRWRTGARHSCARATGCRQRGIAYVFTDRARQARRSTARRCRRRSRASATCRGPISCSPRCRTPASPWTCEPSLLEAKRGERIYHQTDTHWNDRGALVAYQRIIEAVRAQVPATPPAWTRDDFEPVDRVVEGLDLAGMMGLTRVLRETDLTLVPRRPRRARVVEPAGAEPTDRGGTPDHRDPRLVAAARRHLPRFVRVARSCRFCPSTSAARSISGRTISTPASSTRKHPDVVIQEIVGRHLYDFIPSPELVPGH